MTAHTRRWAVVVSAGTLLISGVFATGAEFGEGADATGAATQTAPAAAVLPPTAHPSPPVDTFVTVSGRTIGRPIPPGFVGVSIEYPALSHYTGRNPGAVNPVFEQLLRNLAPGQSPIVRIGGNSTDTTWWPAPRLARPPGESYDLTRRWLGLARTLAQDIGGRMILGVGLEADSPPVAAAEAKALLHGIGSRYVQALEPGNEPLRYAIFPWYRKGLHHLVYARKRSYNYAQFSSDFAGVASVMPTAVKLAGPTFGGNSWISNLGTFLASEPHVRIVTDHTYPLNRCWTRPGMPMYPTVSRLLSTYSSRRLFRGLDQYAALAHNQGLQFRIDEMQSVACGGKRGVSDTFASALWAVDALFSLAKTGVDGVNLHTFPRAAYELFSFQHENGQWSGRVSPEYYGLLMFAQAAPAHARLLHVASLGSSGVRAWSTRATNGTIRVALLNDDVRRAHTVLLRQPLARASLTLAPLGAASAYATSGVTFAGATVSSTTGRLGDMRPTRLARRPAGGGYRVTLPAGSAALVTVRPD